MATKAEIILIEGAKHNVVFVVPNDINLATYNALIQVKNRENSDINIFEFSTVTGLTGGTLTKNITTISGTTTQQLILSIPAKTTVNMNGIYKYQLMLYSNNTDAIKFDIQNFIIKPALVEID